jgi:hypothetical protein
MSAEMGEVERADRSGNHDKFTSFELARRIATSLNALFFKRTQRSVAPRPPPFSWLFISCFQPAERYSSITELTAP